MRYAPVNFHAAYKLAAVTLVVSVLTGLGFAMWLENGTALFLSLAESGLAWCF